LKPLSEQLKQTAEDMKKAWKEEAGA